MSLLFRLILEQDIIFLLNDKEIMFLEKDFCGLKSS